MRSAAACPVRIADSLATLPHCPHAGYAFARGRNDVGVLELEHLRAPGRCPPGKGMVSVYFTDAPGFRCVEASDADLQGELHYEVGGGKDNIGYWSNPNDSASWNFTVTRPGKFQVIADIAAQGSGRFEISIAEQKLPGTAPNTGDYTKFQRTDIPGELDLAKPGVYKLAVKPIADGWQPMNLKVLILKPTGP